MKNTINNDQEKQWKYLKKLLTNKNIKINLNHVNI